MKWTKAKIKKARKSPNSNSGNWCIFVPLTKTEGVKFYMSQDMRDGAYDLQKKAHVVGLGPAVGDKCEMPFLDSWQLPGSEYNRSEIVYGYVTELCNTKRTIRMADYYAFVQKCQDYGISTNDTENGYNCGYLRGQVVRYDFDPNFYLDPDEDMIS
jgi:hypothetical protein